LILVYAGRVLNEHPVCQASSNLLFDQVKRPLQFTDAEISAFELTLCSVDKINACQVLSACSFIFFKYRYIYIYGQLWHFFNMIYSI